MLRCLLKPRSIIGVPCVASQRPTYLKTFRRYRHSDDEEYDDFFYDEISETEEEEKPVIKHHDHSTKNIVREINKTPPSRAMKRKGIFRSIPESHKIPRTVVIPKYVNYKQLASLFKIRLVDSIKEAIKMGVEVEHSEEIVDDEVRRIKHKEIKLYLKKIDCRYDSFRI